MYRIFAKSIFSIFLIVILFVNLLFFSNAIHYWGVGLHVDYRDKFMGFSTLYEFITSGFTEDGGFLVNYQNFLNSYLQKLQQALFGNWLDLLNFPTYSFIDVLRGIGNVLMSIGSIFGFILFGLMYIIFGLCEATWIILKFLSLISGQWFTYMPPNPYDVVTLA